MNSAIFRVHLWRGIERSIYLVEYFLEIMSKCHLSLFLNPLEHISCKTWRKNNRKKSGKNRKKVESKTWTWIIWLFNENVINVRAFIDNHFYVGNFYLCISQKSSTADPQTISFPIFSSLNIFTQSRFKKKNCMWNSYGISPRIFYTYSTGGKRKNKKIQNWVGGAEENACMASYWVTNCS